MKVKYWFLLWDSYSQLTEIALLRVSIFTHQSTYVEQSPGGPQHSALVCSDV